MLCDTLRRHIPDYLSDLVSEVLRRQLRLHFSGCPGCRHYLFTIGSLVGDLKQLAAADMPFDFAQAVKEGFHLYADQTKRRFRRRIVRAAVITAGMSVLLFSVIQGRRFYHAHPPAPSPAPLPAEEPPELKQLKIIQANLERTVGRSEGDQSVPVSAPPKNSGIEIALKPIHLVLSFENAGARKTFVDAVQKYQKKSEFESSDIRIALFDRPALDSLAKSLVSTAGLRAQGGLPDLAGLPATQAPVKISFYMPLWQPAEDESKYFHFRFLLKNSYVLVHRIREAGIKLLYESPDLLILEAGAGQLTGFAVLVKDFPGLQSPSASPDSLMPDGKNAPRRIVIYLED